MTIVYSARRILTMNPARPESTHVAVRDGRILAVGTPGELKGWGPHTLDDRFSGKVLMPGLVEGHSHTSEGTFWRYAYVGYFDRTDTIFARIPCRSCVYTDRATSYSASEPDSHSTSMRRSGS